MGAGQAHRQKAASRFARLRLDGEEHSGQFIGVLFLLGRISSNIMREVAEVFDDLRQSDQRVPAPLRPVP